MKRTLFFTACLMTYMMLFAQEGTNDYIPFVEMGRGPSDLAYSQQS